MDDFIKTTVKPTYSKVIWYVKSEDEKEIKSISGNRPDFIFARTVDEFEKNINPNYYLVYSIEKHNDSDKLTKVIHNHPNCFFHELFATCRLKMSKTHILSRLEKNIKTMWLNDILAELED